MPASIHHNITVLRLFPLFKHFSLPKCVWLRIIPFFISNSNHFYDRWQHRTVTQLSLFITMPRGVLHDLYSYCVRIITRKNIILMTNNTIVTDRFKNTWSASATSGVNYVQLFNVISICQPLLTFQVHVQTITNIIFVEILRSRETRTDTFNVVCKCHFNVTIIDGVLSDRKLGATYMCINIIFYFFHSR